MKQCGCGKQPPCPRIEQNLMKLPFGIYEGKFVHISEVDSGRTTVVCPYCQQKLMAKKGRIKRHHFAHDGAGCTQHFAANFFGITGRLPIKLALSVYAFQKLNKIQTYHQGLTEKAQLYGTAQSPEKVWIPALKKILEDLNQTDTTGNIQQIIYQVDRFLTQKIAPFPEFQLIRLPQLAEGYTDGKRECTFEELTPTSHEYYYPKKIQIYVDFLKNYHQKTIHLKEITTKLALFEKDLSYFRQFDLYFIEVLADHQKIYKIGLTSRPLATRLKEIKQDLSHYFLKTQLKPLFCGKGYAFLETFFKQKYTAHQMKIGQLTEYFSFSSSVVSLILKDLNLLKQPNPPERHQFEWIDWVFFNFNGKIYGYQEKSVYINNIKFVLTKEEVERLETLMQL